MRKFSPVLPNSGLSIDYENIAWFLRNFPDISEEKFSKKRIKKFGRKEKKRTFAIPSGNGKGNEKASSLRRLEDKQAKESIRNAGTDKRNKKEYTKKSLILAQDER